MSANPQRKPKRSPKTRSTKTSGFGVGRRESHDASGFYERFTRPEISDDERVQPPGPVDWIHLGDAREMATRVQPSSVALMVTSPPYFVGKDYEADVAAEGIPADYLDYLSMLREVFAACVEALEPGGRIAVNVANLGRRPYRSLSADVIRILQDDLGLLLRGEVIWRKAEGSSGNCAWGSFQSASNPVLRDLTERVVVASKGRFDRARPKSLRAAESLPAVDSIFRDDFMDWTTDVWSLPTESATRVGHPAPFPVELPQRLIELYTFEGDVVLDPFMGSGSTALAAVRTGRHYVGFDLDPSYVTAARERVRAEQLEPSPAGRLDLRPGRLPEPVDEALRSGATIRGLARAALRWAGFEVPERLRRVAGVELLEARSPDGTTWLVDVAGALTKGSDRAGLRPADVTWRAIGRATTVRAANGGDPGLLLASTALPPARSPLRAALAHAAGPEGPIERIVCLLDPDDLDALAAMNRG